MAPFVPQRNDFPAGKRSHFKEAYPICRTAPLIARGLVMNRLARTTARVEMHAACLAAVAAAWRARPDVGMRIVMRPTAPKALRMLMPAKAIPRAVQWRGAGRKDTIASVKAPNLNSSIASELAAELIDGGGKGIKAVLLMCCKTAAAKKRARAIMLVRLEAMVSGSVVY